MVSLGRDIYSVLVATVPLYVAMLLAYISIKWWKIFTSDQCSGIYKFVAKISVPLLSFHVISASNPYMMNIKLILADTLQKIIVLFVLAIVGRFIFRGSLDWIITGFSLSTLPNTLIVGVPLVKGMYGEEAAKLLGQIVVLQTIIWYSMLLFLYEFRSAQALVGTPSETTTGLFMASQSKIIACGAWMTALAMVMKFILGPGLMAISSYTIGLRGKWLNVAIVQAALPQGIVPFVFAKEYDLHPDILSTGIIIGMLVAVPVALAYYFLLEL